MGLTRPVAIGLLTMLSAASAAGARDYGQYRYILETGAETPVCRHMHVVLNESFRSPWMHPALTGRADDPNYAEGSRYAFPKLPGVAHDRVATQVMSYSRLPTTPEFDAITWYEGRIELGAPAGEGPVLVAEVDIDNDGRKDLIVKSAFMRNHISDSGRGGHDYLYVVDRGLSDLPNPIPLKLFMTKTSEHGHALITPSPAYPYPLVRPFRYDGATYLAGFEVIPHAKSTGGFVHIAKFLGGGYLVKVGKRTNVEVQRVCKLRMRVVGTTK